MIKTCYQGSIIHGFTPLIDNELPVPKEGLRALSKPEADDAEVVFEILDVLGFYKIRVPLLVQ